MCSFDKKNILNEIKKELGYTADFDFAKHLGVSPQTLSNWKKRNTYDAEVIYTKCEWINPVVLLTGKGELKNNGDSIQKNEKKSKSAVENKQNDNSLIPFINNINNILEFDKKSLKLSDENVLYYQVPKFNNIEIDFMTEVKGTSMYPKYNNGDIIACKIIDNSSFIQWNKVHVIKTKEQGILIKRIKPSEEKGNLKMISDNNSFDPFNIPQDKIEAMAVVIGSIKME